MKKQDEPGFYAMAKTHPLPELDAVPETIGFPSLSSNTAMPPGITSLTLPQLQPSLLDGMAALRAAGAGMTGLQNCPDAMLSGRGDGTGSGTNIHIPIHGNFPQHPMGVNNDLANSLFNLTNVGVPGGMIGGGIPNQHLLGMQQGLRQESRQLGSNFGISTIGAFHGIPQATTINGGKAPISQAGASGGLYALPPHMNLIQNNLTGVTNASSIFSGTNTDQGGNISVGRAGSRAVSNHNYT